MAKLSKKKIERASQLDQAKKVLKQLRSESKALGEGKENHSNLSSHLDGFYAEIAVLAKGKTLVEATDLVVVQINDIIRDAKEIVQNDVYLDRIKEFVAAGNNPVYPDVLIVARAIRQSLGRCKTEFEEQTRRINKTTTRAETIIGALECFLSGEENADFALEDDVERFTNGGLDGRCFYYNSSVGAKCFHFDALDSQSVENYIKEIDEESDLQSGTDAINAGDPEDEQEDEAEE